MSMIEAIKQAKLALENEEVPIGAVIVNSNTGKIIASAHNLTETNNDHTAHAEIIAIKEACFKLGAPRIPECDIYVTLEPCPMCATAISFARIRRLYFGAYDPKGGGIEQGACIYNRDTCNHKPEVYGGINEQECAELLKTFFKGKR